MEFGGAITQKELHIPILNGKLATRYTGLGHLGGGSDIIQSLAGPGLGRSQREDGRQQGHQRRGIGWESALRKDAGGILVCSSGCANG